VSISIIDVYESMQVDENINLRQLISLLKVDTPWKINGFIVFSPESSNFGRLNTDKTGRFSM